MGTTGSGAGNFHFIPCSLSPCQISTLVPHAPHCLPAKHMHLASLLLTVTLEMQPACWGTGCQGQDRRYHLRLGFCRTPLPGSAFPALLVFQGMQRAYTEGRWYYNSFSKGGSFSRIRRAGLLLHSPIWLTRGGDLNGARLHWGAGGRLSSFQYTQQG